MAASGFTPIQLYYSTTAAAAPIAGNLVDGELAINITDGKLYYKDNGGVVRLLADRTSTTPVTTLSFGTTGLTPATATSGAITVAGTLAIANGGTGATTNTAARTNLGASTLGANVFTITNPSAITFPRFNADNTVSALNAADFRTAIGAGTGSGTVTSVTGTSPVASSGGATPAISLASGYGDTQNPYASKTANNFLAAPNGTAGVPTFRAIVATDIPTLNQNTTGTAANVTGTVAVINGGTGATTAGNARTNLGATTVGANVFTLTNPSAITFPRFNVDNTVSALSAADFRTAIGAGTGSGTVTSVGGTGTVNGITLTGTVTSSGNLTLGGTLSGVSLTTQVSGTLPIANGGTNATTAAAARTSLGATTLGSNLYTLANVAAIAFPRINADNTVSTLDAATFRTAIGAGTSSTTGTVTSVGGTGTVSGLTLSGTVTTTGNLTLGGTLAVTAANFASQTANNFLAAPNGTAGVPTFRTIVAADIPTLNQNTTGTAANVTGTVAIANGGTGQTSRQNAMDALAGAVTSGSYLRGNGTDVVMSTIQAGDVPTLNQNTTGTAANVTGTVAVANGGTGVTSLTSSRIPYGNGTSAFQSSANLLFNGSALSVGNGTAWGAVNIHATDGNHLYFTNTTNLELVGSITQNGTTGYLTYGSNNYVSMAAFAGHVFNCYGSERARIGDGLSVGTTTEPGSGAIYATGNITAYFSSDRRLKENIQDVDNALGKVCAIGSKTFDWTDEYIASKGGEDGYFVQKSDFGVVAQDVQAVFPQAVRTREDGTLAVDYEKLATLAFGAIKELVKRVEALEDK